jgi:hypothetical protein
MDLQEWKKLSRNEKERMWDLMSESDKDAIKRRRSRSKSHSHGHRHSYAADGIGAVRYIRDAFSGGWLPIALRTIGIVAFFGGIICHFAKPELLGGKGLLNPSLLILVLIGITSAGIASILDWLNAALELTRSIEARLDKLDERLRQRPQNGNGGAAKIPEARN